MIQIDMPMPEKCSDCIFCDDNCSCVASDYNGYGINVGCAYRTGKRDIRCPLKEQEAVVRCKDCKWWDKKEGSNYGYCHACKHGHISDHWEIGIYRTYKGDWFCAEGERKEGGGT